MTQRINQVIFDLICLCGFILEFFQMNIFVKINLILISSPKTAKPDYRERKAVHVFLHIEYTYILVDTILQTMFLLSRFSLQMVAANYINT